MRRLIVACGGFLALALIVLTVLTYVERTLSESISVPDPRLFVITKGESLRSIATRHESDGLIKNALVFTWYTRLEGASGQLKFGEYQFHGEVTQDAILEKLLAGAVAKYQVTFTEGSTFAMYQETLRTTEKLQDDLATLDVHKLLDDAGAPQDTSSLEGLFLPETYQYQSGDTASSILLRAYEHMQHELQSVWESRSENVRVTSPYELLIVASLVEKESGLAQDRPKIAAVIYRRLERRMRLQLDPSVIYALGSAFDGNLTRKDLSVDSPYNTYGVYGLPPTPICSPGRESLLAAAQPSNEPYLYFVARGDGSSEFSRTLARHNKAVQKYQRNR